MREDPKHVARVDALMSRLPDHASPEELVTAFDLAINALWRRTEVTLGSITLSAIVERVLHQTSRTYPLLAVLTVDGHSGVQFVDLRRRISTQDVKLIRQGMHTCLLAFLTIIGTLTGEILTPALHGTLDDLALEDLDRTAEPRAPRTTNPKRQQGPR